MKLKIIRIEPRIVTCEIENTGSLLDVARCYFPDKIEEGKIIDIDVSKIKNNEVC